MFSSAAALQEAFEPGAAVFRPLPLVPVRQQHHEAAEAVPFILAAGEELVDDDLGGVHEVAELALPNDQALRRVDAVPVLEPQHAGLRQAGCCGFRRGPESSDRCRRGMIFAAGLASCSTLWRWEKVPRSASWPVIRSLTGPTEVAARPGPARGRRR